MINELNIKTGDTMSAQKKKKDETRRASKYKMREK